MTYYYHFPTTTEDLKQLTIRQLYKDYRQTAELLHEMKTMKDNGSTYHHGDPIYKKIYDWSRDLKVLTNYITSIGRDVTKIKTNIPASQPAKPATPITAAPVITIDENEIVGFTCSQVTKATDRVMVVRRITDDSPILQSEHCKVIATGNRVKVYEIPAAYVHMGEDIFLNNLETIAGFRIR